MKRRSTVQTLLWLATLLAIVLVFTPGHAASGKPCSFQPLSETVYVIRGSDPVECPASQLRHPATNPVAIIGPQGVVLVDPGSSEEVGQLVLERLREITDQPVVAVINTHIHGLYWLANHAIHQAFPKAPIYAHPRMIERLESGEDQQWIEVFAPAEGATKTKIKRPDQALDGTSVINLNGVALKIRRLPHAHTDHDLTVEIIEDRILVLGGLVVEPEVPSQGVPQDADFKGQIAATRQALDLDMRLYIPGQGLPADRSLVQTSLTFLQALYQGVEQYYPQGLTDYEMTARLKQDLAAFARWYDFEHLGKVIAQIYLQVEQDQF